MKRVCLFPVLFLCLFMYVSCGSHRVEFQPEKVNDLRAPAFPLVTIDPYISAWSFADELNEDPVRHWTGKEHPLIGALRVDGQVYRFMGVGNNPFERKATQKSVNVLPTQTYYTFACGGVELDLIFTSPFLMDDLELMSTPVNYISYQVRSADGNAHDVQFYLEATPQWAVNADYQPVTVSKEEKNGIRYIKAGTKEQPVLGKKGDNVRIDWGYFYLAAGASVNSSMAFAEYHSLKDEFSVEGNLNLSANNYDYNPDMSEEMTAMAYSDNLGQVSKAASGYLMIGYDDLYSIRYFDDNRQGYWKRSGQVDIYQAFEKMQAAYSTIMGRCRAFDSRLMADAGATGSKEYAGLCAIAYRQAIAAHKLVTDSDGNLLFLSKENFSNGSIGTVDVTYPSAPLFLVYNPDLLKGMLTPVFYFSESGKWNKPFAAHDVGTYPLANGQTYPEDMPVEESGNMLILTTAIALREGNPEFARKHWEVLTTWANYLLKEGLDPGNQLCTDDFAGHLARNANLSVKAIMGIAGYGKLAGMMGDSETSGKYLSAAKEMAGKWTVMADDGDHYRLTFDQPGSWSQKYNLVWDKVFGTNLFPPEVFEKEIAWYLSNQQPYGLPLDSRKTYTKSDWIIWTACLADNPDGFDALVAPVYKYANETTTRMPLSDWHETIDGKSVGFRARSVVGGYYMKMLHEKGLLRK